MDGQLQQLDADKRTLEQRVKELKPAEVLLEAIKRIVAETIPADMSSPAPARAAVDMNEVATMVDERLAQVLRDAPPSRVVAISVSEAARELIREGFARDMAEKIRGLTPEPRRIALTVREHGTIKSGDLYALIRGKGKVGRLPVNFNTAIKRLEDIDLVARNPGTGLVSWGLRDCIDGRLIDLADEETRRQLEEYLASLLLPGSAEPR
jgi:hypothetical protein